MRIRLKLVERGVSHAGSYSFVRHACLRSVCKEL